MVQDLLRSQLPQLPTYDYAREPIVFYLMAVPVYFPGPTPGALRLATESISLAVAAGVFLLMREFLYVDDAAEGITLAAERFDKPDPVNLGSGMEISIKDLTHTIARHVGFAGDIRWDTTQPNGQPRRRLDVSRAEREFGFRASMDFEEGLRRTVAWYVEK